MDFEQSMATAVGRAMDKSAALLRIAADAGDSEAQFALGMLYMLGRGVEKNLGEAIHLFGRAADTGDGQAGEFRGRAIEQLAREQAGERLMNDATVAVMKEARRRQRFPKPHIVKSDN